MPKFIEEILPARVRWSDFIFKLAIVIDLMTSLALGYSHIDFSKRIKEMSSGLLIFGDLSELASYRRSRTHPTNNFLSYNSTYRGVRFLPRK